MIKTELTLRTEAVVTATISESNGQRLILTFMDKDQDPDLIYSPAMSAAEAEAVGKALVDAAREVMARPTAGPTTEQPS